MCKKPKAPKIDPVQMPVPPAPPPPPEPVAEAPGTAEGKKRQAERTSKKRGTGALRIELSTGGGGTGATGGLSIPR